MNEMKKLLLISALLLVASNGWAESYSCNWRTVKYMDLPVKNEKSNVKYGCEKGESVSIPARYINTYCDNSQPIYLEEFVSGAISRTNRSDEGLVAFYSCTYNGKKFEVMKNVCILAGSRIDEKCIDTETGDLVKVRRQR